MIRMTRGEAVRNITSAIALFEGYKNSLIVSNKNGRAEITAKQNALSEVQGAITDGFGFPESIFKDADSLLPAKEEEE